MSTQVVLITGGLTGIGHARRRRLRQEGREGGRCRSACAVCFLNKPVTRRDLVSCIQSALHTTLQESSDE
jgi:NAD(P)-dependent dehydrogenase (short-subunit alcohol dehydrogenase family)